VGWSFVGPLGVVGGELGRRAAQLAAASLQGDQMVQSREAPAVNMAMPRSFMCARIVDE
jgi:hypothetical protein